MTNKVDGILAVVCDRYQVPQVDLVGSCRMKGLVEARHAAMWLARDTTNLSLENIAARFDSRHHTTVLHGIRSITEKMLSDPKLVERILEMRAAVMAHREPVDA